MVSEHLRKNAQVVVAPALSASSIRSGCILIRSDPDTRRRRAIS